MGALGSSLMAFQLAVHLCRAIVVVGCYMPRVQQLHQGSLPEAETPGQRYADGGISCDGCSPSLWHYMASLPPARSCR